MLGDLRQLPPADGRKPFFGSPDFHLLFEVFLLAEDRRHEKDKDMQKVKELIAWGGVPVETPDEELTSTNIDPRLTAFFVEGYLQGWGLTPEKVDLEIGTAIFVRKIDVANWNAGMVRRIENTHVQDKHGELQGIDIEACDPRRYGEASPKQHRREELVASNIQ